jgi:hypothetical protein
MSKKPSEIGMLLMGLGRWASASTGIWGTAQEMVIQNY